MGRRRNSTSDNGDYGVEMLSLLQDDGDDASNTKKEVRAMKLSSDPPPNRQEHLESLFWSFVVFWGSSFFYSSFLPDISFFPKYFIAKVPALEAK
jgi:hypothetical protein